MFLCWTLIKQRRNIKQADKAWDDARSESADQIDSSHLQAKDAIYSIRRALPQSELPDIAKMDIIGILDELDSALESSDAPIDPQSLHQILQDIQGQLTQRHPKSNDIQALLGRLSQATQIGREAISEPTGSGLQSSRPVPQ